MALESNMGVHMEVLSHNVTETEALGRQLDQIHDPRLGWFQIWFRRVVWTLTVLILLFALPRVGEIITNLTASPS